MKVNAQDVLALPGQLCKSTQISAIKREENAVLFAALDAYPHHAFSIPGRRNICKRHGITDVELEAALLAYVPLDAPTEAERRAADMARLLSAIEAAVNPSRTPSARKSKGQKGGARK